MSAASTLKQRVRPTLGRVARRLGLRPPPVTREVNGGMVEVFGTRRLEGWIVVPTGAPPVRVALYLDDIEITATWATGVSDRSERTSWSETREFRFWLNHIWRFAHVDEKLTVKVHGKSLPISGHGMFLRPKKDGFRSREWLNARFEQGYVFTQYGRMELSKSLDTEWQQRVMGLFDHERRLIKQHFDYEPFFTYGTLLGAVRENGFIGHDLDLDSAYISSRTTGPEAAQELRDIAFALIDEGYEMQSCRTHLHMTDAAGTRIDIFHMFFDVDGVLRSPFGVAGTSTIRKDDWRGVREIDFPGGTGVLPEPAAQFVEHLYGGDWRLPKPGFHWPLDRTDQAPDGILADELTEEIHWADFYAHTTFADESAFGAAVNARDDRPGVVIDLGCGDGRDSLAFARAGGTVLGLDRSPTGLRHATARAAELGLSERATFRTVDLNDPDQLRHLLTEAVAGAADEPVLFYLRFLLQALSDDGQQGLLDEIGAAARPGDLLAAEFRTDKDAELPKVHPLKFRRRRFQDGPAFGEQLRGRGFELLGEDEGTGLAVFGDEDPEVYRVVARRSG